MSDDKPSPDQEPWRDGMVPAQSYASGPSSLGPVPGSARSMKPLEKAICDLLCRRNAIGVSAEEIYTVVEHHLRAAEKCPFCGTRDCGATWGSDNGTGWAQRTQTCYRRETLDELTAQAQELGMGYGPPNAGAEERRNGASPAADSPESRRG